MEESMQEIFHEKSHAYLAAKFFDYLTKNFGERGKAAFVHATQYYAEQRGRRMAQRAIRDNQPLDFVTYSKYGEWVSTETVKALGQANDNKVIEQNVDFVIQVEHCPWHAQFKEMGMNEAGSVYCEHLDNSICRGFNPYIAYDLEKTLHHSTACIHRIHDANIQPGTDLSKVPGSLRSFEYHCAHIYWSFREAVRAIFAFEGEEVSCRVLQDFAEEYGIAASDVILSYCDENFNIAD